MEMPPEEKIQMLEEMGISKNQAIKALMKYNNDVSRAANYIFSEDAQMEDEEPPPLIKVEDENFQVTTIEVEGPEQADNNLSLLDDGRLIETDSNVAGFSQQVLEAAFANNEQRQISTALANSLAEHNRSTNDLRDVASSNIAQANSSSLALIPYNQAAQEHSKFVPQIPARTYASAQRKPSRYWMDPINPLERQRVNDGAIGLRPLLGEHYINPFLQTLFHIPIVRQAVLAYRPTLNEWGDMDEYWKRSWEPFSLEEICGHKSLAVLYELQKLFGYMHLTKRAYGNAKDFSAVFQSVVLGGNNIDNENFYKELLEQLSYVSTLQAFDVRGEFGNFVHDLKSLFQNEFWKECWVTDVRSGEQVYESDEKDSFKCINVDIQPSDTTIYAALDRMFYDYNQESSQLVCLTQTADVFILYCRRYHHEWPQYKDFQIDKVFYPSRYSYVRRDEVLQKASLMKVLLREIEQVRDELNFLNRYQGRFKSEDLLRSSHEYFGSMEMDSSQILATYLAKTLENRQSRARDLESRLAELEQMQLSIFDNVIESDPYYLRAVLVNEGSLSSWDQHVANIWVPQFGGQGQWVRFADADVEVALEENVLYDRSQGPINLGVYGLVYTRADSEKNMDEVLAGLDSLIPESLRVAIEKDNQAFAIEIQEKVQQDLEENLQRSNNFERRDESQRTWENLLPGGQDPELSEVDILVRLANQVTSESYKVLQRFDFFLTKIQNFAALQTLVEFYVDRDSLREDLEERLAINTMAENDEQIKFAYIAFTIYKENSEIFIKAMQCISVEDYYGAIDWLIDLKQKDIEWVNRHAGSAEVPRPDAVSRKEQIEKYGKSCLKILNDRAYREAMSPAYCSRGLKAGIKLARQSRSFIGNDHFLDDPFISSLREQWLNYADLPRISLDLGQSQNYNTIVMLLIDETSSDFANASSEIDANEIREGLGFDKIQVTAEGTPMELWMRYQKAIDSADDKLKIEFGDSTNELNQ